MEYPKDFTAAGWHIGIKPDSSSLDFGVLHSLLPCAGAAVFTKNNLPGWPVVIGREHAAFGKLRTVIVNSGNANTATGPAGLELARECCKTAAESLGISMQEVLPASTGVIGKPFHIHRGLMLEACRSIPEKIKKRGFEDFSHAVCTTDAFQKTKSIVTKDGICIMGIAKGAGMIEPNMATMLAFLCTDAEIEAVTLKAFLQAAVNRSFNRITVDSDTSTSDTAVLLANGSSGKKITFSREAAEKIQALSYPAIIDEKTLADIPEISAPSRRFFLALLDICVSLAQMIVRDGEGAAKIVELRIEEARDQLQALKIGRAILNSPLFKTAVYGCDPNWGRILMAIGKVFEEPIPREKIKIYLGTHCLFPQKESSQKESSLSSLKKYLQNEKLYMRVLLGQGKSSETLWGCDLNENYIHLNAVYTT